jgi:hypothetical protein
MSWLKAFIHKYILTKAPWSVTTDDGKTLQVLDYNAAFVQGLREELKDQIHGVKTDADVVTLWVGRYNHEREAPRLDVVHGDITADGRVSIKLEWNDAFIRMLQNAGIEGATEDELVRVYLATVTANAARDVDDDLVMDNAPIPPEALARAEGGKDTKPSSKDVTAILDSMDPDVLKMFEKDIRSRAARRKRG